MLLFCFMPSDIKYTVSRLIFHALLFSLTLLQINRISEVTESQSAAVQLLIIYCHFRNYQHWKPGNEEAIEKGTSDNSA